MAAGRGQEPHLERLTSVVAPKHIPYVSGGNRFQNLSIYLPDTSEMAALIGTPTSYLPNPKSACSTYPTNTLATTTKRLLSNAFGADESKWPSASPARFDPAAIADRIRDGNAPRLIVVDQSLDDQLVPIDQKQRLEANLAEVRGLRVVAGHGCVGKHAEPWEQGSIILDSVRDVLTLLKDTP